MSLMDVLNKAEFYAALGIGIPIILLSYRCIFVLAKKEYRKNAFCRIFIAQLISNSFGFVLLMHCIRFASQGWFPDHYESIKNSPLLGAYSWFAGGFYFTSLTLSFFLSLNRVTALYLEEKLNDKIWRHVFFLWVPVMVVIAGVTKLDPLVNKAEYVPVVNPDGSKFYMFINYNQTRNWDLYYIIAECVADLICNVLIILKFIRIRMGTAKRTSFENSLYIVSFLSFLVHTGTTGIQIILRLNWIPVEYIMWGYFVSNTFIDLTVLFPTVAILTLTKEIRNDVKKALAKMARCCCPADDHRQRDTTMTIAPSQPSVTATTSF